MKQIYLHRPNLMVKAEFSPECIPIFRYRLDIIKIGAGPYPRTVCAIMQNPSYAAVDTADKSIQVLERVVFEKHMKEFKNVERLIVVNQFAFIQTNDFVGTDEKIGRKNNKVISKAINESDIILIAWGKSNNFYQRKIDIINIIKATKGKILLQTSMHPSRVHYDGFIQPFCT